MLNRHIALVCESASTHISDLAAMAAALQKRVTRDFAPIQGVSADVGAYAKLEDVPFDYWPIIIQDDLRHPEATGYHEDDLGEPYTLVRVTDDWSVTVSPEMMEILAESVGPAHGSRTIAA